MTARYSVFCGLVFLFLGIHAAAQVSVHGQITEYPDALEPGSKFTIAATSNAERVIFELWQGSKRLWRGNERVRSGTAAEKGRVRRRVDAGTVHFKLIDRDTKVLLDEKTSVILIENDHDTQSSTSSAKSSSRSVQSSVPATGTITSYPTQIIPGEDFTVQTQASVKKLRLALVRGRKKLWRKIVRPDATGYGEVTDDTRSRIDLGPATLILTDRSSRQILDQKDVQLVSEISLPAPQSSSSSSASTQSSSRSSTQSDVVRPTPILFLLPDFPDNNTVQEGDTVKVEIKNGIGHSAIYIDVIYDNNEIVYSHGFTETDVNGKGFVTFQMPYKLLKDGHDKDGLLLRLNHGGIQFEHPFTLKKGLDIHVPSELKEGERFTYTVFRSKGETLVEAGISYDAGPDHTFPRHDTDGSGYAKIGETMPRLIQNGASRDGAEFWVRTKDVKWYFPITIVRGEAEQKAQSTPKRIERSGGAAMYPPPVSNVPHPPATAYVPKDAEGVTHSVGVFPVRPVSGSTPEHSPETYGFIGEFLDIFSTPSIVNESFKGWYDATILDSHTTRIDRVLVQANLPPGFTFLCADVKIYSDGRLVDEETNSCFYDTHSTEWVAFQRSEQSAPRVRRGANEVVIHIVYDGRGLLSGEITSPSYDPIGQAFDAVLGNINGYVRIPFSVP